MRSTIIQGPIGPIHIQEASPSVTSGESEALPIAPQNTINQDLLPNIKFLRRKLAI